MKLSPKLRSASARAREWCQRWTGAALKTSSKGRASDRRRVLESDHASLSPESAITRARAPPRRAIQTDRKTCSSESRVSVQQIAARRCCGACRRQAGHRCSQRAASTKSSDQRPGSGTARQRPSCASGAPSGANPLAISARSCPRPRIISDHRGLLRDSSSARSSRAAVPSTGEQRSSMRPDISIEKGDQRHRTRPRCLASTAPRTGPHVRHHRERGDSRAKLNCPRPQRRCLLPRPSERNRLET